MIEGHAAVVESLKQRSLLGVMLGILSLGAVEAEAAAGRGRPVLNAEHTTFVADNGQLLRGPFTSTEWTPAVPESEIAKMRDLGFNAVHLYAEAFDPKYPAAGSQGPGTHLAEIDKIVRYTRDHGLYLVLTIGNGAANGKYNQKWIEDFWTLYGKRYANETHVIFEIQNEPVAWGPPYSDAKATPPGAVDMEISAYKVIRKYAPDTPVLLFSYSVLGSKGGADAAMKDIRLFNQAVFGKPDAKWTNEAMGFHGYAGFKDNSEAVRLILAEGYPAFMTEFVGGRWGGHGDGLDVELTAALEQMKVSWTTFEHVPPTGVCVDVTDPTKYKNLVEVSGLYWKPDYGSWPVPRGVYGNDGQPRSTTSTFVNNLLAGTTRIEAEDFDTGGQGVAYNNTASKNKGGKYRPDEGVDIIATPDSGGGYAVSRTTSGEWLEYTIFVQEPGFYDLALRYAAPKTGAIRVCANGSDLTGQLTLPSTGGHSTWKTLSQQVFLEWGRQKLRIEIPVGGVDLNWVELTPQSGGPIASGTYMLVNRNSGMAMEFDTAKGKVIQQSSSGSKLQQWKLESLGAGQYRVSSAENGQNWTSWPEMAVVGWWGIEGKAGRFLVRPAGDGFYRIARVDTGADYAVKDASLAGGAAIEPGDYQGEASQQWAILREGDPLFPAGLSASWDQSGHAQLRWNAATGAKSYVVKRATKAGGPYTAIATGVTGTQYTDTTAAQGTWYYYVVSATGKMSLNSQEVCLTTPGLHLKFDEGTGVVAADATGHGWTGTLQEGATWGAGPTRGAVRLDGTNQYVSLPDGVVRGLTQTTIACRVFLDKVSEWNRIFDFSTSTNNCMFLTPQVGDSGSVRFAFLTASGEQQITGKAALPTGRWVHVAVTLSGTEGVLYVDGVEVGRNTSMTLTPSALGKTTHNYLGRSAFPDPYLHGSIDDFRIYDRVLAANEVQQLAR